MKNIRVLKPEFLQYCLIWEFRYPIKRKHGFYTSGHYIPAIPYSEIEDILKDRVNAGFFPGVMGDENIGIGSYAYL